MLAIAQPVFCQKSSSSSSSCGTPAISKEWSASAVVGTTRCYTELTDGHPDPRRAPAALRDALTGMRRRHPRRPSLWASHIHIGI